MPNPKHDSSDEDYDYDEDYQGDNWDTDDNDEDNDHPMLDMWGPASTSPKPDDLEFNVTNEDDVYSMKELRLLGPLPDLPHNPAEYRGYCNDIATKLA